MPRVTRAFTTLILHGTQKLSDILNSVLSNLSFGTGTVTAKGQIRSGQADGQSTNEGFRIGGSNPLMGTEGLNLYLDGYDGWACLRPSRWVSSAEFAILPTPRAGAVDCVSGSSTIKVTLGAMAQAVDIGKPIYVHTSVYTILSIDSVNKTITLDSAVNVTGNYTFSICYNWGTGTATVGSGGLTQSVLGDCFNFTPNIRVRLTSSQGVVSDHTISAFTNTRNVTLYPAPAAGSYTYYWWNNVDNLATALRVHKVADAGFEENLSILASNLGYYEICTMARSTTSPQYPLFLGAGWEAPFVTRHSLTVDQNGDALIGGHYENAPLRVPYNNRLVGGSNRLAIVAGLGSTGTPTVSAEGPGANISIRIAPKGTGTLLTEKGLNVSGAPLYSDDRIIHANEIHPSTDGIIHVGTDQYRYNTVHATNGVIATSDGRLKVVRELTEQELTAAFNIARSVIMFRWKEEPEDTGVHAGYVAQEVIQILEDAGLKPMDYSFVRYYKDSDSYGVNHAELNTFCQAAIVQKLMIL